MKTLITGAFGNLGTLVIELLLERGHQVTAFDLKTKNNEHFARHYNGQVAVEWGDIRDKELVERLVGRHDAVIHLAAIISPFSEKNPRLAEAVNVGGTMNVLNSLVNSPAKPIFVFTSSFAVFGNRQDELPPRTVLDKTFSTDNYSRHKILCEEMIATSSCNWIILRLGAMVDSRMRHSDKEQIRLSLSLSPKNRVEYIHPADAAVAIANALERPASIRKILLIGGGPSCQVTHLELMNAMSGAMGIEFRAEELGHDPLYADWVDSEEAQQILTFQRHTFDDFKHENYQRYRYLRAVVSPVSPAVKSILKTYLKFTSVADRRVSAR